MESIGYHKTGIITFFGFIVFSLVVIWMVNVYMIDEKDYKQREIDMEMSKEILLDTEKINQVFSDMKKNLIIQRDWLEKTIKNGTINSSNTLLSQAIYLESENVSIIDETRIQDTSDFGNLVFNGEISKANTLVENEINSLIEFFKLEKILHNQLSYQMNSIYYSKNGYVTYYPYVEIGEKKVNYKKLFLSVDELIAKIQNLDKEDENFDPKEGWDQAYKDDPNGKNYIFSTAIPVMIDEEIKGILTGSINSTVFRETLNKINEKANVYLIDANNTIIYTNNKETEILSEAVEEFSNKYKVKYYQNKFPTPLEIRQEKDYTLYISEVVKDNWYITYVVDKKTHLSSMKVIFINILMVSMLLGITALYIQFSNKKRYNLDSIIKNSKRDGMTDLLNHKYIMETLKKYLRYIRIRQLAIMMLDIDDFKNINDTFGHAIGDQVIRITASTINSILDEKNGICGRYGGEEFLIIATRTSEDKALQMAEQIRIALNETIYEEMGIHVTVSIGLYYAVKPVNETAVDLVNKADQNLYIAKKAGKNQVHAS